MFLKLAALFILVPTIELIALIFVGSWLGPLPTTLLIIATGLLGTWLARREGVGVLKRLQHDLNKGVPPASRITEGVLILAGGLLLLTPGMFTDLAGFLLILPYSRKRLAPIILRSLAKRFVPGGAKQANEWRVDFGAKNSTAKPESNKNPAKPFDHPIA